MALGIPLCKQKGNLKTHPPQTQTKLKRHLTGTLTSVCEFEASLLCIVGSSTASQGYAERLAKTKTNSKQTDKRKHLFIQVLLDLNLALAEESNK